MGFKNISGGAALGFAAGGPVGAQIGGAMGQNKIQSKLLGNVPERQVAELDQGTQDLMGQAEQRANMSPEEMANQQLRGTEQFGKDAASQVENQNHYSSALGMSDSNDIGSALSKRANKAFNISQSGLKGQALLNAGSQKAGMMNQAAQYAAAKSQIQMQSVQAAKDAAMAKKQQRAALYGAVFGATASAGGMMLGGPAGMNAAQGNGGQTQTYTPSNTVHGNMSSANNNTGMRNA